MTIDTALLVALNPAADALIRAPLIGRLCRLLVVGPADVVLWQLRPA